MNTIKMSFLALSLGLMSFATISAISWKSESIDVGEIPQGKPKAIVFEFKNTGTSDVVITNAQGSCGCTATDYTKTPIKSGNSGTITATYNAANAGAFTKTVTVTTNAETTPKVLTLKGIVKAVVVTN
jgi:hypothetical protein